MRKIKVVIGVIGSDCHAVGNKIMDTLFKEAGFEVTNVGVLSPQEDFVNAAVEVDADAIVVSSLYGQGELDCKGLREKCDEAGLENIKLFVGGNIVVGKQDFKEVKKRFMDMGFDHAYPPGTPFETTIADIKSEFPELVGA